jgi:hypothetical protein
MPPAGSSNQSRRSQPESIRDRETLIEGRYLFLRNAVSRSYQRSTLVTILERPVLPGSSFLSTVPSTMVRQETVCQSISIGLRRSPCTIQLVTQVNPVGWIPARQKSPVYRKSTAYRGFPATKYRAPTPPYQLGRWPAQVARSGVCPAAGTLNEAPNFNTQC